MPFMYPTEQLPLPLRLHKQTNKSGMLPCGGIPDNKFKKPLPASLLQREFSTDKIGTRKCRSVNIGTIFAHSIVDILLIAVEYILHTTVNFKMQLFGQPYIIRQTYTHIPKSGAILSQSCSIVPALCCTSIRPV